MSEKLTTLGDLFSTFRTEQQLQFEREQTPGTPEHAQAAAFTAAYEKRVADDVARVVAAGGIIGVTHTDKGEPIDQNAARRDAEAFLDADRPDPFACAGCGCTLDDDGACPECDCDEGEEEGEDA